MIPKLMFISTAIILGGLVAIILSMDIIGRMSGSFIAGVGVEGFIMGVTCNRLR